MRIEVDAEGEFREALREAWAKVDDLTPAFRAMVPTWFKSNRAFFRLSGPGKFLDLSERYKKQKKAAVGFVYPILLRHGFLAASITEPGDPASIVEMSKRTLTLGTATPYAVYVQKLRPFIMVGAEQTGPEELNVRVQLWQKTIQDYVLEAASGLGKATGAG